MALLSGHLAIEDGEGIKQVGGQRRRNSPADDRSQSRSRTFFADWQKTATLDTVHKQ